MRRLVLCFSVLVLFTAGCGNDSSGGGTAGTGGDLEWPPDATAYFDEYGILNADCATDEDCAMVLGYYHAFDRFVQMDIRRRFSTGRLADLLPKGLAEILNVAGVAADARALFSTRDGQPAEQFLREQSSPKTLALFEAYSAGVNQWIADVQTGENGAVFPLEFSSVLLDYGPDRVPEWTPDDCLATVLALVETLTNDEGAQVNAGLARAAIGADDKFSDLWSRRPLKDSSILPPGWQPPSPAAALVPKRGAANLASRSIPRAPGRNFIPALQKLSARLTATEEVRQMALGARQIGAEVGSNSWVVAPGLTTGGNALLSNDPHLGMTQPATWYLANLDAKTNGSGEIHTAGMTFAGVPWVLIGQNERIAWGFTTTVMDFSDVYLEELVTDGSGNPTGVMFQGAEVPFTRVPFTIAFNDGSTEERELLFVPHHGAVREIDVENGTAVTLRWTGNDIDTDANVFTDLGRAASVEEARIAFEGSTSFGQNMVVSDPEGNIGWFPYNRLPKRTWATNLDGAAPPWLPLIGAGDYEWTEYFALEELPQALNPAESFIA
ncbi:MAG: penicillin acylase family protein, partial [Deltaproteobacteria bacterium]|nr:penicillin acylase family protein [Deltaproteobacteria bacterium]